MVLAAGRRLASYGDRATVAHADASRLPFDDGSFDVAVSVLMLHHVGDWEQAWRELVRVVKPGGRVIGCDLIHSRFLHWSERAFGSGDERLIKSSEFTQAVARLGLRAWHAERGPLHTFRFVLAV